MPASRLSLAAMIAAGSFAAVTVGSAGGHPGHSVEVVEVRGDVPEYSPSAVTIRARDSVWWTWTGAVRNHSVTSDPGQAEEFDSDPGGDPDLSTHPEGDSFVHTFKRAGTFTYHCKVHPAMTGEVEVLPLPGSRPVLSGLQVSGADVCDESGCGRAKGRYRASKAADVVGRIERRKDGRWRTAKSFSRRAKSGRNRLRLPTRSLDEGRYRLSLIAYDQYNRRSPVVRDRFALR